MVISIGEYEKHYKIKIKINIKTKLSLSKLIIIKCFRFKVIAEAL